MTRDAQNKSASNKQLTVVRVFRKIKRHSNGRHLIMRFFVALMAAISVTSSPAIADVDRISFSLGSSHVGMHADFNETNLGVFLTWEDAAGSLDFSAGVYNNSYSNTTVIFTASYDVIEWDSGAAGVFGGVAHYPVRGLKKLPCCGGWVPVGGLQIRRENVFAQFMPMPNSDNYMRGIFTFVLTFPTK